MKSIIKFIPNILTMSRIVMSFIFIYTILREFTYGQDMTSNLIILFLSICASDLLDGKIARKTNSVSKFGAKLDVFADLLYIVISYITLVNMKVLPLWFLMFICFKFTEFVMTSRFMKRNNEFSENPFVFDKIGRIVSAVFLLFLELFVLTNVLKSRIYKL